MRVGAAVCARLVAEARAASCGRKVSVTLGVNVVVAVKVGVDVGVILGVSVAVAVKVGVGVAVAVAVAVNVGVGVAVLVAVAVNVGEDVAVTTKIGASVGCERAEISVARVGEGLDADCLSSGIKINITAAQAKISAPSNNKACLSA